MDIVHDVTAQFNAPVPQRAEDIDRFWDLRSWRRPTTAVRPLRTSRSGRPMTVPGGRSLTRRAGSHCGYRQQCQSRAVRDSASTRSRARPEIQCDSAIRVSKPDGGSCCGSYGSITDHATPRKHVEIAQHPADTGSTATALPGSGRPCWVRRRFCQSGVFRLRTVMSGRVSVMFCSVASRPWLPRARHGARTTPEGNLLYGHPRSATRAGATVP